MSKNENEKSADKLSSIEQPAEAVQDDPFDLSDQLKSEAIPHGVDRRTFLMRSAVVGAAAVMTGWRSVFAVAAQVKPLPPGAEPKGVAGGPGNVELSPTLNHSSRNKKRPRDDDAGRVLHKVGPGPSSSHTIGPMRITYDFYQRCTKLPADQLAKGDRAQG